MKNSRSDDALACTVFGIDGDVVAAVGISGPTMRIAEHHDRLGELLVDESGLLSRTLKRKVTHRRQNIRRPGRKAHHTDETASAPPRAASCLRRHTSGSLI